MVELAIRLLVALAIAAPLAALPVAAQPVTAQTHLPPGPDSLATITARGRALARYDDAAWRASDAAQALAVKPRAGDSTLTGAYVVRQFASGTDVVFGGLTQARDTFRIRVIAHGDGEHGAFTARELDPDQADTGYYLRAARALAVARADFGTRNRPYNEAVIPTDNDEWWVYRYPAPTQAGVWPLGDDVRYRVSGDGRVILVKRVLHRSVLESTIPQGKSAVAFHTAVVDDVPEDTDVFLVMQRQPPTAEYIITVPGRVIYRINTDGSIVFDGHFTPPEQPSTPPAKP